MHRLPYYTLQTGTLFLLLIFALQCAAQRPLQLIVQPTPVFVPETLAPGAHIPQVTACARKDNDVLAPIRPSTRAPNSQPYTLMIVDGDPRGNFNLDAINDTCWRVLLQRVLDADVPGGTSFVLTLKLIDGNRRLPPAYANLDIGVVDVNENAPVFVAPTPNAIDVSEDTAFGARLFTVSTNDVDGGLGGISVMSLKDSYDDTFNITRAKCANNRCTASVHLTGELNYDHRSTYTLTIVAEDGAGRTNLTNRAEHTVTLRVLDEQNSPPKFIGDNSLHHVREDALVGTRLFKVQAIDGDANASSRRRIEYSLSDDNDDKALQYFGIDPATGFVYVKSPLDSDSREMVATNGVMTLTVIATELSPNGRASGSAQRHVSIAIDDVDDSRPRCAHENYRAEVVENAAKGVPLTMLSEPTIEVFDEDRGEYGIFNVALSGPSASIFTVVPTKVEQRGALIIRVEGVIDYEQAVEHHLQIMLIADGQSSINACNLTVFVRDANDNTPKTEKAEYVVKVKENLPAGTFVTQIRAFDEDSSLYGPLRFSLEGSGAGKFRIDDSGNVTTFASLDREDIPRYELIVTVTDNNGKGNRAVATLVVVVDDDNDHPPVFTQQTYMAYLMENTEHFNQMPNGLFVKAIDDDLAGSNNANVTYWLDGEYAANFTIDVVTGQVRPAPPGVDRERLDADTINITLIARDQGYPLQQQSVATLVIAVNDTNDNAPVFAQSLYNISVPEDIQGGETLMQVLATDKDADAANARVTYSLAVPHDLFKIEPMTGFLKLKNGQTLDLSKTDTSTYDLNVQASDNGQPPLSTQCSVHIRVKDLNNRAPYFVQPNMTVQLPENTPPYTLIARVTAKDDDYDAALMYTKARVVDAVDANGAPVNEELFNYNAIFVVQAKTGEMYLTESIDREHLQSVSVVIAVTDVNAVTGTQSAEATVNILIQDVNDNAPTFSQHMYTSTVQENSRIGTLIVRTQASDLDASTDALQYSLATDALSYIDVDSRTGNIRVAGLIDHEEVQWINTTVYVSDGEHNSSALVAIKVTDQNDNRPTFAPNGTYHGSVYEGSKSGTPVLQVEATDADSDAVLRYSLLKSVPPLPFAIDTKSGVVTVNGVLDRETRDYYTLTVKVTDDDSDTTVAHETTALVDIKVLDVNDNAPQFLPSTPTRLVVRESDLRGEQVLMVTAIDNDEARSDNAAIVYSIVANPSLADDASALFTIDALSGALSLAQNLTSKFGLYRLTLRATDKGTPPLANEIFIDVQVLDYNDNRPVIERPLAGATYTLFENAPVATAPLFTVSAVDADSGDNAVLRYSLQPETHFRIDNATGAVYARAPLDREEIAIHDLVAIVCDSGRPPQCSDVQFHVQVNDVNDNCPRFEHNQDNIVLTQRENVGAFSPAIDLDSEPHNSRVCYRILNTQPDGAPFALTAVNSTQLVNTAFLDREMLAKYKLLISTEECTDNVTNLSAMAECERTATAIWENPGAAAIIVVVEIEDENDMPPQFTQRIYRAGAVRGDETMIGTTVGRVRAVDVDINDTVTYRLIPPIVAALSSGTVDESYDAFAVDASTGDIRANIAFAPEWAGVFTFDVQAIDAANHTDVATVVVHVLSAEQQIELIFDSSVNTVWTSAHEIIRLLNEATGHNATIDRVSVASSETLRDRNEKIATRGTVSTVLVHFVDEFENAISPVDAIRALDAPLTEEQASARRALVDEHKLRYAGATQLRAINARTNTVVYFAFGGAVLALCIAITLITVLWYTHRTKYRRRLKAATIFAGSTYGSPISHVDLLPPGTNVYDTQANPLWSAVEVPDSAKSHESAYDRNGLTSRSAARSIGSEFLVNAPDFISAGTRFTANYGTSRPGTAASRQSRRPTKGLRRTAPSPPDADTRRNTPTILAALTSTEL